MAAVAAIVCTPAGKLIRLIRTKEKARAIEWRASLCKFAESGEQQLRASAFGLELARSFAPLIWLNIEAAPLAPPPPLESIIQSTSLTCTRGGRAHKYPRQLASRRARQAFLLPSMSKCCCSARPEQTPGSLLAVLAQGAKCSGHKVAHSGRPHGKY